MPEGFLGLTTQATTCRRCAAYWRGGATRVKTAPTRSMAMDRGPSGARGSVPTAASSSSGSGGRFRPAPNSNEVAGFSLRSFPPHARVKAWFHVPAVEDGDHADRSTCRVPRLRQRAGRPALPPRAARGIAAAPVDLAGGGGPGPVRAGGPDQRHASPKSTRSSGGTARAWRSSTSPATPTPTACCWSRQAGRRPPTPRGWRDTSAARGA